ncbi:hypothetical protein RJ641_017698 [Dillenia turbinata]|uniref:Uncharacterized protein n=1 Tax=Dillenia turbinata TaxID=194707 RepID=A0AAN8UWV5_9MAGN
MPQELPGFYYDAEKNRYFPIKGPIPGSASSRSKPPPNPISKPQLQPQHAGNIQRRMKTKTAKLLHVRELGGTINTSSKRICNFQEEYLKTRASQPMVWKYQGTDRIADSALGQMRIDIQTPEGQRETEILLTGGMNGSLSLLEVEEVGQCFDYGVNCAPDRVWPPLLGAQAEGSQMPGYILQLLGGSVFMPSSVSSIKVSGNHSPCTPDNGFTIRQALITTLGSETSGGSVNFWNLAEPLDFSPAISVIRHTLKGVASFSCTIWTADCNFNEGTNLGASLVDLETGLTSWFFRTKSDVLSQQLDQSGNIVLCGLRNGALVTVDVRQRQEGTHATLRRHQISYPSSKIPKSLNRAASNSTSKWFEVKGSVYSSRNIFMPSSISCLAPLQFYGPYFLASSMDGSMRLYDHRLMQRGAVQSYEGNVNSHTRLQFAVDPFERFVLSGGEDCKTRLWSLRSGKMLFEEKISDSICSAVDWPSIKRQGISPSNDIYGQGQNHGSDAWLGSKEGLYRLHCYE